MDKHFLSIIAALALVFSCQKENGAVPADQTIEERNPANARAFPPTAHPYGKSITDWTADWWRHMYSFGPDDYPILLSDADGPGVSQAGLNTTGPVIFLAGSFGQTVTRTITVPHGKALLFPLINFFNDYPCPEEFNFEPAPGQSLEEFLLSPAVPVFENMISNLSVTLDGNSLNNLTNYRHTTGLFKFTGNPELTALDPCVTGTEQDAVSDGYWIMLKPLGYGQHTLNFHSEIPDWGFVVDVTFNITVQ